MDICPWVGRPQILNSVTNEGGGHAGIQHDLAREAIKSAADAATDRLTQSAASLSSARSYSRVFRKIWTGLRRDGKTLAANYKTVGRRGESRDEKPRV
jgi:hypothetical protein